MKRQRRTWAALAAAGVVATSIQAGCGPDAAQSEDLPAYIRDALGQILADTWPEVMQSHLSDALRAADDLAEATAALDADPSSARSLTDARNAWEDALAVWQRLEVMQIGPMASSLTAVGGRDLRDAVYSWPLTNRCLVDQRTLRRDFSSESFFDDVLVNSTGFDALETLLFSDPASHACPSQVISDAQWSDLGVSGIEEARAEYAAVLARRIASDVDDVADLWASEFATSLAKPGTADSLFTDELSAANALFDALFYLETHVKDQKLGWALGTTTCGEDDCSSKLESPIAGRSSAWISENLSGFRALFTGGNGMGLHDLLIIVEEPELADRVLDALDAADGAVAALDGPLDQVDTTSLEEAHAAIKAVTDLLRTDVATVLMLQVPSEAAGDND